MKIAMKNRIKGFLFKIWIRRPATKLDVVNSRYEVSVLLKAVKEIEVMNRADITTLIFKLNELEKEKSGEKSKVFKNEGSMYA